MKKPHLSVSISNVSKSKSGRYSYDSRFNLDFWSEENLELAEFLRYVADCIEKEYKDYEKRNY